MKAIDWILALFLLGIWISYGIHIAKLHPSKPIQQEVSLEVFWPPILTDPDFEYEGEHVRERAIADGLTGWGLSHAGNKAPQQFGMGMAKISEIVGTALPEKLIEEAKKLKLGR